MRVDRYMVVLLGLGALLLSACGAGTSVERGGTGEEAGEADAPSQGGDDRGGGDVVGSAPGVTFDAENRQCSDGTDPFEGVPDDLSTRLYRRWPDTNFCLRSIAYNEVSTLLGADQIPPIDSPSFDPIGDANRRIADQEPVIVFVENSDARAYPLAILTWHEIVNDTVGGRPVAVTYCPLCNAAIVFDRTVDGEELTFGTSGNLRNSDLIMWDRQTNSWWQQFTGEAIVGEMTGTQLEFLPSQVTSWAEFKDAYPDGQALDIAALRDYGRNPYVGYDSNSRPFAFTGEIDDRLFPVERVLGVIQGGEAIAYPFEALAQEGVISDTVAGRDIVIFYQPGQVSALDGASIEESREVGSAAAFDPTLDGQKLTFSYDDGVITDHETGSTWNVFGQATDGPLTGEALDPILAYPHFWFAWAAFQPDTAVWEAR